LISDFTKRNNLFSETAEYRFMVPKFDIKLVRVAFSLDSVGR